MAAGSCGSGIRKPSATCSTTLLPTRHSSAPKASPHGPTCRRALPMKRSRPRWKLRAGPRLTRGIIRNPDKTAYASRRQRNRLLERAVLGCVDLLQELDVLHADAIPAVGFRCRDCTLTQTLHQGGVGERGGELDCDIVRIHPDPEAVDAVLEIFLDAPGRSGEYGQGAGHR